MDEYKDKLTVKQAAKISAKAKQHFINYPKETEVLITGDGHSYFPREIKAAQAHAAAKGNGILITVEKDDQVITGEMPEPKVIPAPVRVKKKKVPAKR